MAGAATADPCPAALRLPIEDDHIPIDTLIDHLRQKGEREEREIPISIGFFRKVITCPVSGRR